MSIKSGITSDTPSKILFGAGVFFAGVTYDDKAAPTENEIKEKLLGATQDGGSVTITPEFFAPELDGATVKIKELQKKVAETASMETSFAELTADNIAHMVIGDVGETTDKKYDVVTSAELSEGNTYQGFGFMGELLDGRPVIIIFKNALCTSGMNTEGKNKNNAVFKGTFECMSDIAYSTTKLPYAIFIHKKDAWQLASVEEAEG